MLDPAKIPLSAVGALLAIGCIAQPLAHATLIGDSIEGLLTSSEEVTSQFISPAAIGAGSEFSGVITDFLGQVWNIEVDIGASSFTVAFTEEGVLGPGNGNLFGEGLLEIGLSDLDWVGTPSIITGLVNSAYSCSSPGISCTAVDEGPFIRALTFTADSVGVTLDALRHGELYTFDMTTQQVPEPAGVELLGLGLLAAFVMNRCNVRARCG